MIRMKEAADRWKGHRALPELRRLRSVAFIRISPEVLIPSSTSRLKLTKMTSSSHSYVHV